MYYIFRCKTPERQMRQAVGVCKRIGLMNRHGYWNPFSVQNTYVFPKPDEIPVTKHPKES
jgi:hypothetical protein